MALIAFDGFRPNREGPYQAVCASSKNPNWPLWYVESNGVNCLSGPEGAVLTTRDVALSLSTQWNSER